MTDVSFWPHAHVLSSSHEQFPPQQKGGHSFYLHLQGCSQKTAWPGEMTPPLHPGLPGSYQSQRVCKTFFLWDSSSSAGTCGKPVSHYSLVLSLSQWSIRSTFLVLGGYQFSPISLEKKTKPKKVFNMFTNNIILLFIVILNTRSKSNPCNFFNGEQLNLKPFRAIQYLHCNTRLCWQDKLVL